MLTISRPCPRCLHEKSILSIRWAEAAVANASHILRETLVACVHCGRHSIAILRAPGNVNLDGPHVSFSGDVEKKHGITVTQLLPTPPKSNAPESLPQTVANAYLEGKAILDRTMWTPAAGSFRTALDRATKILWAQEMPGESMPFKLEARLKGLNRFVSLPDAILDWADKVRVVGNEMHELDDVSREDAHDVAHFCEMFLTYTFTLPARVAKFNQRREPEQVDK